MDLNRDGVLAASIKLGTACRSGPLWSLLASKDVCGGLDLADALSRVLVSEEGPQAPASAELLSVRRWAEAHLPKECLDILEVSRSLGLRVLSGPRGMRRSRGIPRSPRPLRSPRHPWCSLLTVSSRETLA